MKKMFVDFNLMIRLYDRDGYTTGAVVDDVISVTLPLHTSGSLDLSRAASIIVSELEREYKREYKCEISEAAKVDWKGIDDGRK